MAAGAVLSGHPFPAGTSVPCYPIAKCEPYKDQKRVPPLTATETETVASDSTLTYDALTAYTGYYAVASVGGVVRYVAFHSGADA